MNIAIAIIIATIIFATAYTLVYFNKTVETFVSGSDQITLISGKHTNDKLSVHQLNSCLAVDETGTNGSECKDMPIMSEDERLLINYHVLGCRFTGYLGPMINGIWDPVNAVQLAVKAGCRVFVLEIDYVPNFGDYFPRICIRDKNNNSVTNSDDLTVPNTLTNSNITTVCNNINEYAFNSTDPVIIVLYFIRQPSTEPNSDINLEYFSNVAKCISQSSIYSRLLKIETNGTFNRQSQENILLTSPISNYENKVLIFSNADTSGFRPAVNTNAAYKPTEDLDFLVNLRLYSTQTRLGVTAIGNSNGVLQTATDYLQIGKDKENSAIKDTRSKWTICFSDDPSIPVDSDLYNKIKKYGINCVPVVLFDAKSDFMFETFKMYNYIPKLPELRVPKPTIAVAQKVSPLVNANKGVLVPYTGAGSTKSTGSGAKSTGAK